MDLPEGDDLRLQRDDVEIAHQVGQFVKVFTDLLLGGVRFTDADQHGAFDFFPGFFSNIDHKPGTYPNKY